jgi:DNA-binding XRE family transcriptional regulator
MATVLVANADRMMTQARAGKDGIELKFADGAEGLIPFADIPEIGEASRLASIEIPNPYLIELKNREGGVAEIPWDYARHYCDPGYRPHVEALGIAGRGSLGRRIRDARQTAGMTQQDLASAAGIGRVTLVRIEKGEQSPRYETLAALAKALGRPFGELVG